MSRLNKSMTSSLSINKNRCTHSHSNSFTSSHTYAHTHTEGLADISQALWLWVFISFIFIPQFHHSLASCSLAPLWFSFLFLSQPYCFSSYLHCSLFLFFIQTHCFYFCLFLFHINLFFTHAVSLPQASCVYISVVYFYKCQTVFLPSVYWSTESEGDEEREAQRKGGKPMTMKEGGIYRGRSC